MPKNSHTFLKPIVNNKCPDPPECLQPMPVAVASLARPAAAAVAAHTSGLVTASLPVDSDSVAPAPSAPAPASPTPARAPNDEVLPPTVVVPREVPAANRKNLLKARKVKSKSNKCSKLI